MLRIGDWVRYSNIYRSLFGLIYDDNKQRLSLVVNIATIRPTRIIAHLDNGKRLFPNHLRFVRRERNPIEVGLDYLADKEGVFNNPLIMADCLDDKYHQTQLADKIRMAVKYGKFWPFFYARLKGKLDKWCEHYDPIYAQQLIDSTAKKKQELAVGRQYANMLLQNVRDE